MRLINNQMECVIKHLLQTQLNKNYKTSHNMTNYKAKLQREYRMQQQTSFDENFSINHMSKKVI